MRPNEVVTDDLDSGVAAAERFLADESGCGPAFLSFDGFPYGIPAWPGMTLDYVKVTGPRDGSGSVVFEMMLHGKPNGECPGKALLAENERLKHERDRWRRECDKWSRKFDGMVEYHARSYRLAFRIALAVILALSVWIAWPVLASLLEAR